MSGRKKDEIITFKADEALMDALEKVPNRSEFIRNAVLSALDNSCPLCGGTGILSVDQKRHWLAFARSHKLEECGECHAIHLVCDSRAEES